MEHQGNDRMPFWTDGARGFHETQDAWWESALHAMLVLAVVALIVVGIIWLVRRLSAPGGPLATSPAAATPALATGATAPATAAVARADDGAIAALRLRYARGEVDRDTYLTTFADLTGRAEPWPGDRSASEAPTVVGPPTPAEPSGTTEAPASDAEGERPGSSS